MDLLKQSGIGAWVTKISLARGSFPLWILFMIKRALLAVGGLLGYVLPLAAQQTFPDGLGQAAGDSEFAQVNVALSRTWSGFPSLELADRHDFAFPGSFGWMNEQPDFLPAFAAQPVRRSRSARARAIAPMDLESSDQLAGARRNLFYTGGEMGFVYGRYTGKNGGDFKQGYIIGEIGNDHFRFSVGASYGEWSGSGPRGRR